MTASGEKRAPGTEAAGDEGAARYPRDVRDKASRFAAARRRRDPWWRHVVHVGALGWLVALPTVLGALAGRWLAAHTGERRFALAGLLIGLVLGLVAAALRLRASLRDDEGGR